MSVRIGYCCSNCGISHFGTVGMTNCPKCEAGTHFFKPGLAPSHSNPYQSESTCELDGIGPDPAIRPSYYNGRDVMDIINRYKLNESFCLGNVVKYILREKGKGGLKDLRKAAWYLKEEIRIREEGGK